MKMGFPTRLRESGSNRTPTQQGQNKLSLSFRQFAGKALASGISLNFSQTSRVSDGPVLRSQSVTNDGCPISARFWQMWDSTNLGPLSVKGVDDHGHQDLLPVENDRWTAVESH